MKFKIREGNYAKMGVVQLDNEVVFTFAGEKEDSCCIVLIEKKTGVEEKINVPDEYCLGSLRSVSVSGIKAINYFYYFEKNGIKEIDPYATAISGREVWNDTRRKENDYEILGAYADTNFDWQEDKAPELLRDELLMYKLHVRGYTKEGRNKSSGTFSGISNKLSYITSLGVNAIEFMPLYEFEEIVVPKKAPLPDYVTWDSKDEDIIFPIEEVEEENKVNYWGYGSGNYFAVKASYASKPENAANELKTLIRTLHKNNIECIMEMFFVPITNHNLILDVLRYWVREFHIDGFHLLGDNLPITAIVQDVMLSRTKIFYEDFDMGVVHSDRNYKPLYVYKEEYIYPSRKLLNHMNGEMRQFLNQQKKQGIDVGYVNYITNNNGFTLADLFMYNDRHNEANGENNFDGNPWNFSNNYGIEGPTRKKFVRSIRSLKWRNAMAMLYLAQGVPMLWAGDEISNSQNGNNNAYCQDNEVGWINWRNEKTHRNELEFLKKLINFRKTHKIICNRMPYQFCDYKSLGAPDLSYHAETAWISEYELDRMSVGLMYCGKYSDSEEEQESVYIGYNFFSARTNLALPKLEKGKNWYLLSDTTNEKDPFFDEPVLNKSQQYVTMNPQAICILVGK